MAETQVVSFEPSHCPTCDRRIDGIRRGRTVEDGPFEPSTIEPCGHTLDSYSVKVGEVTYGR